MLKTLAGQIKEYKTPSIITPCFMILEVLMEMLIPLLMASIIDDGVEAGNLSHIFVMGGLMLVIACISLFSGIMGGRFGAEASTGFAKNLRKAMFENIQTFSFANIDKFSTAGLITRLTTDVTNVQNAYQMILRICFRAPISLICALFMSFYISPKLASVYVVAVIILGLFLSFMITKAHRYFSATFEKYDELNASIQENVSAIRVVKAFVREDYEKERFGKANTNLSQMFTQAEKILAFNGPLMQLASYGCIIAISWLGAKMIVVGDLSTGNLMSLLTYCMNILMNLMMLSMIFVMLTMSAAAGKRICEVLNEKSTLTNPEYPDYDIPDGSIVFDHVTFRYNDHAQRPILDDINLTIHSGETIGIIGGTGSSKSSLVNLISRLYDVNEGRVLVGGKDVRTYDMDTLRNEVSVVLQKNVLFSGTIYENLRWGDKNATDEECQHACKLDDSRMAMKPISNRVEPMFPEVRNSVFVLPEHFLRSQKF